MRWISVLLCVAASAPALAASPSPCPIERATYQLKGFADSATLRFVNDPKLARQSLLSAVLKSNVTGRTYKFRFAASNGYSTQYLVPVRKPDIDSTSDDSLSFYMFDDLMRRTDLPNPGEPAPHHLFIPALGSTLWYGEQVKGQKEREAIETEIWDVTQCAR